jgi:hypothetical protein
MKHGMLLWGVKALEGYEREDWSAAGTQQHKIHRGSFSGLAKVGSLRPPFIYLVMSVDFACRRMLGSQL